MRFIRGGVIFVAVTLVVGNVSSRAAASPSLEAEAKQILETAGVTGGLLVHLGCADGRLTVELAKAERFLIQGVDRDAAAIERGRQSMTAKNLYGRTSIRRLQGDRLPYLDQSVNLLVVGDRIGLSDKELRRVVAPLGVLMIREGDTWVKQVKPWPDDIDEWTHFLHGPDNNAVAGDRVVGPPRHLRWFADPLHLRSHEHLNSLSALVTARGRLFYIIDEGPIASVVAPSQWRLVARDAFNGKLLWKREIGPWEGHFRLFRSGPPDMARRLVAVGDRVYAVQGYGKSVEAFDAATGETIRVYDETKGAVEILFESGRLYVLTGTIDPEQWKQAAAKYYPTPAPRNKAVVVVDADSGELLWRHANPDTLAILPSTLAVADGRVFAQNTRQVVCWAAESGQLQWRADRPVYTTRLSWSTPTLVVQKGIVLSADGSTGGLKQEAKRGEDAVRWVMSDQDIRRHPTGDLFAFSAETGKKIWSGTSLQNFCSPGDVFVFDDSVVAGGDVAPGQMELNTRLDLHTGKLISQAADLPPAGGHTRCYRNKATGRFLLLGSSGVEFVNVDDWQWTADTWLRGTCQFGVMPANGLLYVPPDSCACRLNVRLHGFSAMAPENATVNAADDTTQNALEKGPAFDRDVSPNPPKTDAWPTYRHDNGRAGATSARVDGPVDLAWRTELGGRLTSLTANADIVVVSRIDSDTIHVLETESGKQRWSRTVGGPVDSPPTLDGDCVVCGCRDGWVYCFSAADGELVWRYHAAPAERFLVAQERIESVWPVHGSVTIRNQRVWCVAGRSCFLDGGLRLLALDLKTGQPVVDRRLDGRDAAIWQAGAQGQQSAVRNRMPGTLPDILSVRDGRLFMRFTAFDDQGNVVPPVTPHLFSNTGFLDQTWWHRTYWQYGTWARGGFGGWPQAARQTPAGRLLVVKSDTVYGFGREEYDVGNPTGVHAGHVGVIKDGYQDSGHVDHSQNPLHVFAAHLPPAETTIRRSKSTPKYRWQHGSRIIARTLLLAGKTLWMAGPDVKKDNVALGEVGTKQPGQIISLLATDGSAQFDHAIDSVPVLDGMIALPDRLLLSCEDGSVRCFKTR